MKMTDKDETSTETDAKPTKKEPDSVIEVRHTYDAPIIKKPTSKDVKEEKVDKSQNSDDGEEESTTVTVDDTSTKDDDGKEVPNIKEVKAQLAKEKKRREELELIVEAEATKSFEKDKTDFLNLIPDENKRNELSEKIGDDPDSLNQYKMMSSFLTDALERAGVTVTGKSENGEENEGGNGEESDDANNGESEEEETDSEDEEEETTPTGRATLPEGGNKPVGAENYKAYVDELYEILKNPTKTPQEKQIADKQVNELFGEMLRGIKATGQLPHLPPISECPNCGYILSNPETETCPRCGWKHQVK